VLHATCGRGRRKRGVSVAFIRVHMHSTSHSFHDNTISPLIDRAAALSPMLLWPRHSSSYCSAHCNIEGRRGGCKCRHWLRSADMLLITIVCFLQFIPWACRLACMREAPFLMSCHVHTVPLLHSTRARLQVVRSVSGRTEPSQDYQGAA
jgi:hypothetical protein